MTRDIVEDRKSSGKKPEAKSATTPRQVALVVPHATADAGVTFETAMEVLDQDLQVHKLWQAQPKGPRKRRDKTPA
jgi:hypothetical protein